MAKKNNNNEVYFGTIILDTDIEDITAPWRKLIKGTILEEADYLDKFCLYLTLYNNFNVEYKDSYPKRISTVDTYCAFLSVLFWLAKEHGEETIKDIKLLFEYWINFLNDNVDILDKLTDHDSWMTAFKRFSILLTNIFENEETEDKNE